MRMAERVKRRMTLDRKKVMISIRIPEDVIEDLKEVAPSVGFEGYQGLIRAYIGQGLLKDLARLEEEERIKEQLIREPATTEIVFEKGAKRERVSMGDGREGSLDRT